MAEVSKTFALLLIGGTIGFLVGLVTAKILQTLSLLLMAGQAQRMKVQLDSFAGQLKRETERAEALETIARQMNDGVPMAEILKTMPPKMRREFKRSKR